MFRPFAGSGEWQAARGQEARASRGRRGAKGAALRVAILCWKLLRSRLQRGGSSPEKSRGALRRAGCGWGHSRAPASKKRPGPLAGVMRETHGKTGCARQDRPSAGERLFRRRIYHATTSQIDRSGMGGDFSTGLKYRGLVPGFAGNRGSGWRAIEEGEREHVVVEWRSGLRLRPAPRATVCYGYAGLDGEPGRSARDSWMKNRACVARDHLRRFNSDGVGPSDTPAATQLEARAGLWHTR